MIWHSLKALDLPDIKKNWSYIFSAMLFVYNLVLSPADVATYRVQNMTLYDVRGIF